MVAQKALILYNKKALLLRRSDARRETHGGKWELAGGCLEFGENLEYGFNREILEETGLVVEKDRLLHASSLAPQYPGQEMQFVFLYYLCHANTDKDKISDEHSEFLWATREQALRLGVELVPKCVVDAVSMDILE